MRHQTCTAASPRDVARQRATAAMTAAGSRGRRRVGTQRQQRSGAAGDTAAMAKFSMVTSARQTASSSAATDGGGDGWWATRRRMVGERLATAAMVPMEAVAAAAALPVRIRYVDGGRGMPYGAAQTAHATTRRGAAPRGSPAVASPLHLSSRRRSCSIEYNNATMILRDGGQLSVVRWRSCATSSAASVAAVGWRAPTGRSRHSHSARSCQRLKDLVCSGFPAKITPTSWRLCHSK